MKTNQFSKMTCFWKIFLILNALQCMVICNAIPAQRIDQEISQFQDPNNDPNASDLLQNSAGKSSNTNQAIPYDDNLEAFVEEALDDNVPSNPYVPIYVQNNEGIADVIPVNNKEEIEDEEFSDSPDEEDMETASTMIFRPLFRYKKKSIQKKRVYTDRNGNIASKPTSIPSRPSSNDKVDHYSGGVRRNPPSILVYDPSTGGYYPASGYNQYPSYVPSYPAYYRNA